MVDIDIHSIFFFFHTMESVATVSFVVTNILLNIFFFFLHRHSFKASLVFISQISQINSNPRARMPWKSTGTKSGIHLQYSPTEGRALHQPVQGNAVSNQSLQQQWSVIRAQNSVRVCTELFQASECSCLNKDTFTEQWKWSSRRSTEALQTES